MKKYIFLFGALFLSFFGNAQKEITISTIPNDADIFEISSTGIETKLGTGSVLVKLEKEKPIIFEVRKPGYISVKKTILRDKNGGPTETIELVDRSVLINALPADATIFLNGKELGVSPQMITIAKDLNVTIDIKKSGFVSTGKTLYNKQGQETLELKYILKLEDRVVSIKGEPIDASILIDGKKKGEGTIQVAIPKDKCVVVRIEKPGYVANETTYCNKELETAPPLTDVIRVKDRIIPITVQTEDARIFVDGKEVGKANYSLKLGYGKCAEVIVMKQGFVGNRLSLCNQTDAPVPELSYSISLKEDEAYLQSEPSSLANKNFSLTVENHTILPPDAWKRLVSTIQSRFDEIETIDFSTSYLKTSWVGKIFNTGSDFKSMIRTRVIITYGGEVNKYNIKIQSEISKLESICTRSANATNSFSSSSNLSTKNDDCFEPFDRILRIYGDLISEIQRRFK